MTFNQKEYDLRCEWGLHGAQTLSPICDAIIIVDVLLGLGDGEISSS
ncbi:MAG: hypothetical protein GVY04_19630 [Cyanobacteria bacterium]|nr:hypothetical protein [Cyanobacteria bacterium GSL.Bin1]